MSVRDRLLKLNRLLDSFKKHDRKLHTLKNFHDALSNINYSSKKSLEVASKNFHKLAKLVSEKQPFIRAEKYLFKLTKHKKFLRQTKMFVDKVLTILDKEIAQAKISLVFSKAKVGKEIMNIYQSIHGPQAKATPANFARLDSAIREARALIREFHQ